MRKSLLILLIFAGLTVAIAAQEARVSFTIAFVKRAADGSPARVDFSERVNIKASNLFKIFLQPSAERLRALEPLVTSYQKTVSQKGSSAAAVNATRQAVLDEIRRLIKEHGQLTAAAEKPVTIGEGWNG